MWKLLFESYWHLIRIGFLMHTRSGFTSVHTLVRNQKVEPAAAPSTLKRETLCRAFDLACVFYAKRVLCLQRSAATAILLRRHGFQAEMVIGAKQIPFRAHAWVEIEGRVVNDKPYVVEIYQELERC